MRTDCIPVSSDRRPARRPKRLLLAAWRRFVRMLRVMEERRLLAQLDERALRDIGLTRGRARFEAGRPPWDLPEHADDDPRRGGG